MKSVGIGLVIMASFFAGHAQHPDVIRVKCISDGFKPVWKRSFKRLVPELEKCGLSFVETDPDVILTSNITDEILQLNTPIIKLERNDSATLENKKRFLKHHLVKGIFKNTILQPITLFNEAKHIRGRYHFELIQRCAQISYDFAPQQHTYAPEVLKKIFLVPWDCWSSCFSPKFDDAKKFPLDLDQERPIDVFFVGSLRRDRTAKSSPLYCWHRQKAYEILKNLQDINVLVVDGKPFEYSDYMEKLRASKIVVSPWGWGEWCYRDCEAMVSGAVLIKPDTSFVKTMPRLYINNVTYVPCRPDFSDVEQKIRGVLNKYSQYMTMRKRARKIMTRKTHIAQLADHFVTCMRMALTQASDGQDVR